MSSRPIAAAVAGLSVLVAGAPPASALGPASAPPPAVVRLTNELTFVPDRITVAAGQSVEWRNGSLLVHTVTDDPAKEAKPGDAVLPPGAAPYDSGKLEPGATFRHTFRVPGIYRYFCIPHEGAKMVGEVLVSAASLGGRR